MEVKPPFVHFSVVDGRNKPVFDGRTASPPQVGDFIMAFGVRYVVRKRTWGMAVETLGADATRQWGHGEADLAYVTLHCRRTA